MEPSVPSETTVAMEPLTSPSPLGDTTDCADAHTVQDQQLKDQVTIINQEIKNCLPPTLPDDVVEPLALADIPRLCQLRCKLGLVLSLVCWCAGVWMNTQDLLPVFLTRSVEVTTGRCLLIHSVIGGFSLSVFLFLVSAVLDVMWLVCLLHYLRRKYFSKSQEVVLKWDYITEVLMATIVTLTHAGLALLLICFAVYQLFLRYDGLRVTYTIEKSSENISPYKFVWAITSCMAFKAIFYTGSEYYRIFLVWCYNRTDISITGKKSKNKSAVVGGTVSTKAQGKPMVSECESHVTEIVDVRSEKHKSHNEM